MKALLASGLIRFLLYVLILIVFPATTFFTWYLATQYLTILPIEWVLIGTQVIIGLFVLTIFLSTRGDAIATATYEQDLYRSAQKFANLYDQSPVPYLTIDRHGRITTYNLAAIRLFQTDIEHLAGHSLLQNLRFDSEQAFSLLLEKIEKGITVSKDEVQLVTFENRERWVQLSVFVYGNRNERLVALLDITEQKAVDQAKSEFVALAAHQLRTPISAIRWNVELLETLSEGGPDAPQAKYYEKINRNILRMINLINDFLSVSKLETGTFATKPEEIVLDAFLESIIEENQAKIEQQQLTLERSFEPAGVSLTIDTRLLHIVFNNLLSNAAKYTPAGGTVKLQYRLHGDALDIEVSDSGIGIPAGELDHLFTKFYRASNAQSHRTEGTGLGLYVVKQSVEKLGGTIAVSSEENVGTTFTVHLPI